MAKKEIRPLEGFEKEDGMEECGLYEYIVSNPILAPIADGHARHLLIPKTKGKNKGQPKPMNTSFNKVIRKTLTLLQTTIDPEKIPVTEFLSDFMWVILFKPEFYSLSFTRSTKRGEKIISKECGKTVSAATILYPYLALKEARRRYSEDHIWDSLTVLINLFGAIGYYFLEFRKRGGNASYDYLDEKKYRYYDIDYRNIIDERSPVHHIENWMKKYYHRVDWENRAKGTIVDGITEELMISDLNRVSKNNYKCHNCDTIHDERHDCTGKYGICPDLEILPIEKEDEEKK